MVPTPHAVFLTHSQERAPLRFQKASQVDRLAQTTEGNTIKVTLLNR